MTCVWHTEQYPGPSLASEAGSLALDDFGAGVLVVEVAIAVEVVLVVGVVIGTRILAII